jgi:predicted N-acetyltransferase YhbS
MALAADTASPTVALERPQDAGAVERLVLRAFGPGRFPKAAERLREGREPRLDLSFVAWDGKRLVGCVRQSDVRVEAAPAILLGPIAVDSAYRHHGLGGALIEAAVAAATQASLTMIVLVGDMPLFGPHGFQVAPKLVMPGPVDQRRVLARVLAQGAVAEGRVSAA